jgi:hypothetical protein
MRSSLANILMRQDALTSGRATQIIANVLWALGKMDAHWSEVPSDSLASAFVRVNTSTNNTNSDARTGQHVSNSLYGLAMMGASWQSLPVELREAVLQGIENTIGIMSNQVKQSILISSSFDNHAPILVFLSLILTFNNLCYHCMDKRKSPILCIRSHC